MLAMTVFNDSTPAALSDGDKTSLATRIAGLLNNNTAGMCVVGVSELLATLNADDRNTVVQRAIVLGANAASAMQCLQNANTSAPAPTSTSTPMTTKAKIGIAAGLVGAVAVGAVVATYAIKHQRWPL